MAKLGAVLVALLGICQGGYAQGLPDLSSLAFLPRPLSSSPLPIVAGPPAKASEAASAIREAKAQRPPGDAAPAQLTAAIERRLAAVSKEEGENGERSPALIDRLTSLAAAYQEVGDYDSAIAALGDARNVVRVNSGLHSLDQASIVESLIANEEAKAEYGEVAKQRKYLRGLVLENPDDPRVVGVLTGLARSEMDSARRLLDVPAPPAYIVNTVPIGASDQPLPSAATPSLPPQKPALQALYAARSDYVVAIQAAAKMRTGNVPDLFALEDGLVETVYFEFAHSVLHGPHRLYAGTHVFSHRPQIPAGGAMPLGAVGAQILRSKLLDSINFGLEPTAVAKALIALGDWLLVYSQNGEALSQYQAAHDVLVEGKVPAETIDAMLSPELPPVVPVLPAAAAAGEQDQPYRGYIDASLELTRFGDAKHLDVLDTSPGVSRAIERRLRRYISSSRFRPRFVDGELARSDKFRARFYFSY